MDAVSKMAAAIGEPARARMLYALMDRRARTSTELGVVAGIGASTASAHLGRLLAEGLIKVEAQGKHRYYSLENARVARVLESLSVLAGEPRKTFVPHTPPRLRAARTCYDHIAGALGVAIHDRMQTLGWISRYRVTEAGEAMLARLGADVSAARKSRRRFAFGCLDWSERRPHVGGALGAAILKMALDRRWVAQDLDSRALEVTRTGRRELAARLGIEC